jgi:hypothetical protein
MIDDQELAYESINLKIATAAATSSSSQIQEMQIKAHQHKETLDQAYQELEKLITKLDELGSD